MSFRKGYIMRMSLDCFSCYMRQTLQASRMSTPDVRLHWKAMRAAAEYLLDLTPEHDGIEASEELHQRIKRALGDPDPYIKVKEQFTRIAEEVTARIEELALQGDDPLVAAVKLAIAGNIIDFGADTAHALCNGIDTALDVNFDIENIDSFSAAFEKSKTILFIGDNTGEVYFEKPLLRLMQGKEVTYVVRGGPILNDVTMDYALRAGLDKLARLTDTGLSAPGFPMERVRSDVRAMFDAAEMVIAKGMGNFESLLDVKRPRVFCLLKAKCDLVASMLQVRHGAVLLLECGRFEMHSI